MSSHVCQIYLGAPSVGYSVYYTRTMYVPVCCFLQGRNCAHTTGKGTSLGRRSARREMSGRLGRTNHLGGRKKQVEALKPDPKSTHTGMKSRTIDRRTFSRPPAPLLLAAYRQVVRAAEKCRKGSAAVYVHADNNIHVFLALKLIISFLSRMDEWSRQVSPLSNSESA
jgi:hypothetical protein